MGVIRKSGEYSYKLGVIGKNIKKSIVKTKGIYKLEKLVKKLGNIYKFGITAKLGNI